MTGLSLDGDYGANKFRKDESGQNSFYKIVKAAETLKKYGAEFNILAVLTGFTARRGKEIYTFFKSEGFKNIQFIPCLKPFGFNGESKLFMNENEYGDFLCNVFKLYANDYKKGKYISVRQFDNFVWLYLGGSAEQCGMNGFCSRQFVCEGNGNIYPCDFYCTDEYLLGNINEKSFAEIAFCGTAKNLLRAAAKHPKNAKTANTLIFAGRAGAGALGRARTTARHTKNFLKSVIPSLKILIT